MTNGVREVHYTDKLVSKFDVLAWCNIFFDAPLLGPLYTPSLPDGSSDVDTDTHSLRKDSTNSDPYSLSSKDTGGNGEAPKSSVHPVSVTSLSWIDSLVADGLVSSIVKGRMRSTT
jgi:hypothetical protein